MLCYICNKEYSDMRSFSNHLRFNEHIKVQDYYDTYLKKPGEGICIKDGCNNHTKFDCLEHGYKHHCSSKCSNADKKVQLKQRETTIKNFGVKRPAQNKDVMKKMQNTCIELYGATNGHGKEQTEKMCKNNLEKYGIEHIWQREDVKEKSKKTKLQRYGNPTYTNREKAFKTIKENGWYASRLEDRYINDLRKIYPDIIRRYKSSKYPFECDFYVPSIDLYIEFNCFWMHGGHWFDENDYNDQMTLNYWESKNTKQHQYAIYIWTKRDIIKKTVAENHQLNYLVFWSENNIKHFISTKLGDKYV